MKPTADFSRLLQAFFLERLMRQQQASPHTIASYRDTFRLLVTFAQQQLKLAPTRLAVQDLDTNLIISFLDHLEKDRGNSARSRNSRLTAIHSFFRYVALSEPALGGLAQRILLLPRKRYDRKPVDFLTQPETAALLAAPDRGTWTGRRDYALMLVAVQTGLRVSELAGLCWGSVTLGVGASVKCSGKGRKERCTPLGKEVAALLRTWSRESGSDPQAPVFPNARGAGLSRDGIEYIIAKHAAAARRQCPSLERKRVSPHVLRHTSAMNLLQHGVDRTVIAMWLGHESVETTDVYLHANLEMKERALARSAPPKLKPGRYKPSDEVLAFLKSL
jgi:site-specific recombinase XerD